MLKITLNAGPSWHRVEAGEISFELLIQPMTHLAKVQVHDAHDRGLAEEMRLTLDACKDWRSVCDANEQPIAFSRLGLDVLMGQEPKIANAILDVVFKASGLLPDGLPADPTKPAASAVGKAPPSAS